MAKLEMKEIQIAAVRADRKRLLETLQAYGSVEIRHKGAEGFAEIDTSSEISAFERTAQTADQALTVLNTVAPQKKSLLASLNGRRILENEAYKDGCKQAVKIIDRCYDIIALDKQLGECRAEVARIRLALKELEPWMNLDVPVSFLGTKTSQAFIGSFGEQMTASEVIEKLAGFDRPFDIDIIGSEFMQTCVFAVCLKEDAAEFGERLRSAGFAPLTADLKDGRLPREQAAYLKKRMEALEHEVVLIDKMISDFSEERQDIEFAYDYYKTRAEKYETISQLIHSKNTFVLYGFIPAIYAETVKSELEERFTAAVSVADPAPEAEVPVALCNGGFSKPCESVTEMYSMPAKGDVDPTSFMAFFFYLFFGMMLSDAGYGLLLTFGTLFILKKCNLEDRMRNNIKLFFFGGISTTFWGFMFGSFFGDVIPKVSAHFFGTEIVLKPIWIDPIKDPITLLVAGIALGIIHIFLGMGINFYLLCKSGRIKDAIFDVGFWFLTIVGLLLLLGGAVTGMNAMSTAGAVMAIGGAVGLVLTQGRNKKGIGKVVSGLASLYNITGYASDILSYSRLMALGLATGVIASVVNILGTMMGGFAGFILFVVVFLIGNAINLGINALGAYVHTIRLQYVEFFSKFYEGGGRVFHPFRMNTKYIRIKK